MTRRMSLVFTFELVERRVLLSVAPDDSLVAYQSALMSTGVAEAWAQTTGSSNVTVAVIDTGIDYTHPDLYSNIWINQAEIPKAVKAKLRDVDRDGIITFYDLNHRLNKRAVFDVNRNGYIDPQDLLAKYRNDGRGGWVDRKNGATFPGDPYVDDIFGWNFAANNNDPFDFDGHGTHTAGIIGATGNNGIGISGVAQRVSLMPLKIFNDDGSGATRENIARAIRYAADAGSQVSNNSWGAYGGSVGDSLYNAISYAQSKGHTFVAAAGNQGVNNDTSAYRSYPASYNLSNIISVGATNSIGLPASYSNFGATSVDIAAPGSSILSTFTGGGYAYLTGTSMSTPFITGAVALMLSRDPSLTPTELKASIIAGADRNPYLVGRNVAGGSLNIARSFQAANAIEAGTLNAQAVLSSPQTGTFYTFSNTRIADLVFFDRASA